LVTRAATTAYQGGALALHALPGLAISEFDTGGRKGFPYPSDYPFGERPTRAFEITNGDFRDANMARQDLLWPAKRAALTCSPVIIFAAGITRRGASRL
jgi:hypothetical protein